MDTRRLMRQAECAALADVSVQTWHRWVLAKKAPQPVNMPGKPRWLRREVERWIEGLQSKK